MKQTDTSLPRCQPTDLTAYSTLSKGYSLAAQRQRLLAALMAEQSATTLDIRRDLDILHPCGRVLELRKAGWNIVTSRVVQETTGGQLHIVGRYTLLQMQGEAA